MQGIVFKFYVHRQYRTVNQRLGYHPLSIQRETVFPNLIIAGLGTPSRWSYHRSQDLGVRDMPTRKMMNRRIERKLERLVVIMVCGLDYQFMGGSGMNVNCQDSQSFKRWLFACFNLSRCFTSTQNNKPLLEKKRRARINSSLEQLKSLVLDALKKDVSFMFSVSRLVCSYIDLEYLLDLLDLDVDSSRSTLEHKTRSRLVVYMMMICQIQIYSLDLDPVLDLRLGLGQGLDLQIQIYSTSLLCLWISAEIVNRFLRKIIITRSRLVQKIYIDQTRSSPDLPRRGIYYLDLDY